ncbi:MAG: B12-binding domain-containing radical SAM protein [Thermodesulfobacteriota bacterium]
MNNQADAILIYPQLGAFDGFVRDVPLSLIYAAADSVKHGFKVEILDLRLVGEEWRQEIDRRMSPACKVVGLSVMTGNPIKTSLNVSQYVKEKYGVPVVWGGPHPTILPEQTLAHPLIDYVVRDWGSQALLGLLRHLAGEDARLMDIPGLGWKENGEVRLAPAQDCFEKVHHRDLPYHLVQIDGRSYNRLENGEVIFPIFTAMGCPYKCTFCMSPAVYRKVRGKKWLADPVEEVLEHIEFISGRYQAQRIQILDDDSFVDLDRMHDLLRRYVAKGFHKRYKLDFRGARINELDLMDDDYLSLMEEAGVELLMIGVESGSDTVLKLMGKAITSEQILRVNRKLARHPRLQPNYNFFCGIPGETYQTLVETKNLLVQLVKDHPTCYLGMGSYWKAYPGTVLYEKAVAQWNVELPQDLEGWIRFDSFEEGAIDYPWITPAMHQMISLLQLAGMLLDCKKDRLHHNMGRVKGNILHWLALAYLPILRLRLATNYTGLFVEPWVRNYVVKNISRLIAR